MLTLISSTSLFDFEKDNADNTVATTSVVTTFVDYDNVPDPPGCDEDLTEPTEAVSTAARTTSLPQIDYGWGEEPGLS